MKMKNTKIHLSTKREHGVIETVGKLGVCIRGHTLMVMRGIESSATTLVEEDIACACGGGGGGGVGGGGLCERTIKRVGLGQKRNGDPKPKTTNKSRTHHQSKYHQVVG